MINVFGDLMMIEEGIICHQTNCLGIMGAGIALQIKNKWPHVYRDYVNFCKLMAPGATTLLGSVCISNASPRIYIAHIFGQEKIGHGKLTSYDAVDLSLCKLKEKMKDPSLGDNYRIFFPEFMGCGYGGGKWEIYRSIIEKYFPNGTIIHYVKNKKPLIT